jgi:hypothetical protein
VLITAELDTDKDTTAADMFVDLDLELNAFGIHISKCAHEIENRSLLEIAFTQA